jgi:hypothetical protein
MKAAFVAKWLTAVPGREKAAIAYGRDVDEFFAKKAADGVCTEPKWFFAPTGENMWFIEGEYEALFGLYATPEVEKFLVKGPILLQGFGYDLYRTGREEMFERYEEALTELRII